MADIQIGDILPLRAGQMIAVAAGAAEWLTPVWGAISHNIGSILVVALSSSIRFAKT